MTPRTGVSLLAKRREIILRTLPLSSGAAWWEEASRGVRIGGMVKRVYGSFLQSEFLCFRFLFPRSDKFYLAQRIEFDR